MLRHSTAHLMAQAVFDLFPGREVRHRPGDRRRLLLRLRAARRPHFTDDDLERIEARMREIVKEDQPFVRAEYGADGRARAVRRPAVQARDHRNVTSGAAEEGDADEVTGDGTVGVYSNVRARRLDGLRRPLPRAARAVDRQARRVQADAGRRRVLARRREAPAAPADLRHGVGEQGRARPSTCTGSRRRSGATTASSASSSTCSRSPTRSAPGSRCSIRRAAPSARVMEDYSRERHEAAGYEFVYSPHITKSHLFEISGHLDWFADGMYPPMELDGGTEYYLKPMNCPFHILIFRSRTRSYRELPLRLFEFGTVYRYEKSGVVHGLTACRGLTQDDAHIFCAKEQVAERARVAAALRARPAARLRPRRLLPRAVDQARGQGGRHRRGVGRGHRGAPRRRRRGRTSSS